MDRAHFLRRNGAPFPCLSLPRRLASLERLLERFWNSSGYWWLLSALAVGFLAADCTLAGLGILLLTASLFLACCPDLLASLYPLLLIMLLSTRYYENNAVLYRCGWMLVIPAAALGIRLIRYPASAGAGRFDGSLAAVSAAALLGGAGVISKEEYFSPVGLYYSLGLGILMWGVYRLFRSELIRPLSYSLTRRFACILYAAGLFTAVLVLDRYLPYADFFLREWKVIHIPCRNYFATILLLALPVPFSLLQENRWHAVGAAILYSAALLTGSRSALLFGTALGLSSLLWHCGRSSLSRRRRRLLLPLLCALAFGIVFLAANTLFLSREIDGSLFSPEDSRLTFLRLALKDFFGHPLLGIGLANQRHSHVFLGVTGSIVWYHNYFAQIAGSMGLVGLFAYGWQLKERVRLLWELRGTEAEVLPLVYLGALLISLTNPGEFSPLPTEFLVIVLFAVAERAAELQAQ